MPSKRKTTKNRPAKRPARNTRPTPAEPPKLHKFRLSFSDGVAPREIEAVNLSKAEEVGRRLSGAFAFAEPV